MPQGIPGRIYIGWAGGAWGWGAANVEGRSRSDSNTDDDDDYDDTMFREG